VWCLVRHVVSLGRVREDDALAEDDASLHSYADDESMETFYREEFRLNRVEANSRFHLVLQNYVTLRHGHTCDYRPAELTNLFSGLLLLSRRIPLSGMNSAPCDNRSVWTATVTKLIALHGAGVEDGSIDPLTGLVK
jgi:hypothetical protein